MRLLAALACPLLAGGCWIGQRPADSTYDVYVTNRSDLTHYVELALDWNGALIRESRAVDPRTSGMLRTTMASGFEHGVMTVRDATCTLVGMLEWTEDTVTLEIDVDGSIELAPGFGSGDAASEDLASGWYDDAPDSYCRPARPRPR